MSLEELQQILKEKKFWIFVAVLIGLSIVLIVVFTRQYSKQPIVTGDEPLVNVPTPGVKVIRVEPLPDQGGVTTSPTIKIIFDKSILTKTVTVAFSPKIDFSKTVSPKGYTVTLSPKSALKPSTKYTGNVTIKKTKIYSWSFTTGKKGADPAVINKIKSELPFLGEHFIVSYSSTSDKFFVTIDAKPIDKYKKTAKDWFISQGLLEPEKEINIFYYIVGAAAD